jgi:magnesium transporter
VIPIANKAGQHPEMAHKITGGRWISAIDPSTEEIARLEQELGIPQSFMLHSLDIDEMARAEKDGDTLLIVLRIPYFQGKDAPIPYRSISLGVIIHDNVIVTVCKQHHAILRAISFDHMRELAARQPNRFVLQLLMSAVDTYLSYLREINRMVDALEDKLQASLKNKEVLELLRYQKSLVYFTTGLKSNELMMERLQKSQFFHLDSDDEEFLQDVFTEIRQAIEMTNISSDILSQMMDAFASIISNNLNVVMKFLTLFTIILTFPTMVASFYGMNVGLPWQSSPYAFWLALAISLGMSLIIALVFWRKNWF